MRGRSMWAWVLWRSFFLALVCGVSGAVVQGDDGQAVEGNVEHGRYLVHSVAKCVECHSPRDARGSLDRSRLLMGAPVPVKSPYPNRPWAFQAPTIAGLPGWAPQELVQLLTTGKRASGYVPRPPMPEYRLSRQDAADVAAYLKSLR